MHDFGQCEITTRKRLIVIEEKRSRICFKNPDQQRVRWIQIDGCAITDGPKCDCLLINRSLVEHYVELKGSDVEWAFEQIEQTIKLVSEDATGCEKNAFVISFRCPLSSTELQEKARYFKKKYSTRLVVKPPNFETFI